MANQAASQPFEEVDLEASPDTTASPVKARRRRAQPLLFEVAWEVCNKLGGIYTVIRSKAPAMVKQWGNRYYLLGPYNPSQAAVEFEPTAATGPVGQVVKQMRDMGIGVHIGRWLVTGRPNVVLFNYLDVFHYMHDIKYRLWKDHNIGTPGENELLNNVVAFGETVRVFMQLLGEQQGERRDLIAHFHEWMAGVAVPMLRKDNWPGATVFTTHATLLGRYLAMNNDWFYDHLTYFDPHKEADKYRVAPQTSIERAAAHGSHVFTTVSDITALECKHLIGREPDCLVPNGLNIQRFLALHEFQNMHKQFKLKIHEFTTGHFFPSYPIDLDKTLYFFTSGRFEYRNKGMDMTVEALARLNYLLQSSGSDVTVVAFIITQQPYKSINVTALQSGAMLGEFRTIADAIKQEIGEAIFHAASRGEVPDLNHVVDEYWTLRLRRAIHAWKRDLPPGIVTHDLIHDDKDPLLNQLRTVRLWNHEHDRVKVIYHPDFLNPTNPLFKMEYEQFVRGCHLGVFPSYYEPWGYTPLESIALGVPAITSDLAGFGSYLRQALPDHAEKGLYVLPRRYKSWDESAHLLAQRMFEFTKMSRRERIALRNKVESLSVHFDWSNLGKHYAQAHETALERVGT